LTPEELKPKFLGALIGTAVGDALGMPVEGWSYEEIEAEYGELREMYDGRLPAGHYTDDTEMMIGVAESLAAKKGFNGEDMAQRFIDNYDPCRGYGSGPPNVFKKILRGEPWNRASVALFGVGSYGNGGAMRIAPIGLLYEKPDEVSRVVSQSSQITHAHKLGKEGATLQAYTISLAARTDPASPLDPKIFLAKLQGFVNGDIYREKLEKVALLLGAASSKSRVIEVLGHGIEAFNSVPTAIYSFLSHPQSFEEAVVYAVGLGGDTDTLGAMTGAISGAYLGVGAIPTRWEERLENWSYIEKLAEKLWSLRYGGK